MKILVIGGSSSIGKEVCENFSPNSFSVSRSNGYDIRKLEDRIKISDLSLEYDAVLNHAYCGDHSQTHMLEALIYKWDENKKNGYIFNTGTVNTYYDRSDWNMYPVHKNLQDDIIKRAAKRCQYNGFTFRITNIRPGMLDTEKSRQKSHWPGSGVTGDTFCNVINYLYYLPNGVIIPEIVLETRTPDE
jgi:NAD(P)-dependent dehydrogenase (short-subunit alcohol dehydrogenase family)